MNKVIFSTVDTARCLASRSEGKIKDFSLSPCELYKIRNDFSFLERDAFVDVTSHFLRETTS